MVQELVEHYTLRFQEFKVTVVLFTWSNELYYNNIKYESSWNKTSQISIIWMSCSSYSRFIIIIFTSISRSYNNGINRQKL
ncbi:hypothetical protein D0868_05647 [Hortaea werneckii]|uniref:Uncharacterized protein n=3 Tax=Hortaea werneckii TaxID=91943 RepID=A0A3M7B986_HORWE|nr:hypothetical protein D0868_05647 [Hortaea werneckii]RMY36247.1 hypothetical protein D0866_04058 [Hortaea werneckii]